MNRRDKTHILLVEDNPGDARLVRELLSEDPYDSFELQYVEDLQSAELAMLEIDPDVVLLDLGLPDSQGIKTLETMYRHNPRVPIVVLTGFDQEELGLQAVREGAQDYLSKGQIEGRTLVRSLHFAIQRKANEEQIRQMLRHDLLTELPNRRALGEELSARIHSRQQGVHLGILFINLDQFKLLNENYGNRSADQVLKELGQRLKDTLREGDFVARYLRDEYVVLLNLQTSIVSPALTSVVTKVQSAISAPVSIKSGAQNASLQLTGSIGVVSYQIGNSPVEEGLADRLIGNAETAMKKAKMSGGNHYHFFDEKLDSEAKKRVRIASGLQNALKKREFELHYQPIINAREGNLFGYEALLRWRPKEGEGATPDEFIPILEESFQIVAVGEWVMDNAAAQYRNWVDKGVISENTRLFINFSPKQFINPNLERYSSELLDTYGIPPGVLHYEITENLLLSGAQFVLDRLHSLKSMGISIAIDDFGCGFSSMNYLKDMPCDFLKIDKSFILTLEQSERNRVIASAILHLGESLGISVIAEGVETESAQSILSQWHCFYQQGFHYARPMDMETFEAWLTQNDAVRVYN